MKSLRALLAIGFVAALIAGSPANAAQQVLCAPDAVASATGARRVVNPVTSNAYGLNSAGCALVAQADIGYFLTQGYTPGSSEGTILFTTGVIASGTTDMVIGSIPPGMYIQEITYSNAIASAVTGGISIGTTANGTDVVAAQTVGSSALTFTPSASILKQVFSTTAATPLHAAAVTSWNGANVTITVKYAAF